MKYCDHLERPTPIRDYEIYGPPQLKIWNGGLVVVGLFDGNPAHCDDES